MSVLHPGILVAGLAAVALPVLIHLLMRRRKQPVAWGAMRFILEAHRRTRRRLLLEKWLLLACRCALVGALAVALARPMTGVSAAPTGGRTVYLLIDNALASQLNKGSSLERHKAAARVLVGQLGDGDRVALITLGAPASGVILPPSADLGGVLSAIDSIEPTDAGCGLASGIALAGESLAQRRADEGDRERGNAQAVVVLSDLLSGSVDTREALPKLPPGVKLVAMPPGAGGDNLAVSAVRVLRPVLAPSAASGQVVTVKLTRSGPGVGAEASVPVRVTLTNPDGQRSEPVTAPARFGPGERETRVSTAIDTRGIVTTHGAVLSVQIEPDAVEGDNVYRLPLIGRESLRVGLIVEPSSSGRSAAGAGESVKPGRWMSLALRPSDAAAVEIVDVEPSSMDSGLLAGLDAVVVLSPQVLEDQAWKRLRAYADAQGLVIVTPPEGVSVHTWTDAMTRALGVRLGLTRQSRELGPEQGRVSPVAQALAPEADLLAPIRGELEALVRPVSVSRVLTPAPGETTSMHALLSLTDGTPVIYAGRPGSGESAPGAGGLGQVVVFACAMDLSWWDVPAKPLAVPLVQEIVRQGIGRARQTGVIVAGSVLRAEGPGEAVSVGEPEVPGARMRTVPLDGAGLSAEPVRRAGLWQSVGLRGQHRGMLAVNADAQAGRCDPADRASLSAWLSSSLPDTGASSAWMSETPDMGAVLRSTPRGTPTGSLWVQGLIALGLMELGLSRLGSHRATRSAGRVATLTGVARA